MTKEREKKKKVSYRIMLLGSRSPLQDELLRFIVDRKLQCIDGNDTDTVRHVPAIETSPTLLPEDGRDRMPRTVVLRLPLCSTALSPLDGHPLDLEEDLETLERSHGSLRDHSRTWVREMGWWGGMRCIGKIMAWDTREGWGGGAHLHRQRTSGEPWISRSGHRSHPQAWTWLQGGGVGWDRVLDLRR